jgi:hypothetical protein
MPKEELPLSYGKKDYTQSIRIRPEQILKAPNNAQLDYPHIFVWAGSYHSISVNGLK